MKKSAVLLYSVIFWIIVFIDIAGISSGSSIINALAKPLLIPALLLLLLFSTASLHSKNLIVAALLFSFSGDVLLLFESKGPLFFIGGLASFLATHICYILYFINIKSPRPSLIRKQPWLAALIAAFGISLVQLLLPGLGSLTLPVIIYTIVICTMMICSLHVFLKTGAPSNRLFAAGALLFIASDSMLAMNKFYKPFSAASVLIILTYCAAQFCIVQGVIQRKQ